MLLGTKPSFDDIMDCIEAMEQEINRLLINRVGGYPLVE